MIQSSLGMTMALAMSFSSLPPEDKILVTGSLTSRVGSTVASEYHKLGGRGKLAQDTLAEKLQAELPGLATRGGDQVLTYTFTQRALNCQLDIPVYVTETAGEYDRVRLMGDTGQIKADCSLK